VDEGALLSNLPMDIRRDIKPQLCLDRVRRVPLFDEMDEWLRPVLHTHLERKLDPVDTRLFNTSGYLNTYRAQGGRAAPTEAPKENMPIGSIGTGSRSGG
jgi:cyclic nucleotide gated channel, plant